MAAGNFGTPPKYYLTKSILHFYCYIKDEREVNWMPADIDKKKLKVDKERLSSVPEETKIQLMDEAVIVVTQAFCPNGHNLIYRDDIHFDGYKGISLWVSDGETEGEVILSPIHGDHRKVTDVIYRTGTHLTISCPICKTPLPTMGNCRCEWKGEFVKIYLTPKLQDNHIIAVCNIWGCANSRVIDEFQIISEYIDEDEEEEDEL